MFKSPSHESPLSHIAHGILAQVPEYTGVVDRSMYRLRVATFTENPNFAVEFSPNAQQKAAKTVNNVVSTVRYDLQGNETVQIEQVPTTMGNTAGDVTAETSTPSVSSAVSGQPPTAQAELAVEEINTATQSPGNATPISLEAGDNETMALSEADQRTLLIEQAQRTVSDARSWYDSQSNGGIS